MILVFTPTHEKGPHPDMMASVSQQSYTDFVHEVNWLTDPLPGRNVANVVRQYQIGQAMALAGDYDAMLTLEHDMILPANAIELLMATPAPVVYGLYLLRHGTPTLNAWERLPNKNLGMSLSLYPAKLRQARRRGWAEVSGVGWGCTLIRREALEQVRIHSNADSDAGDLTFATDCLKRGIKQIARFDVICGHIDDNGLILEPFKNGGVVLRVHANQNVNVVANGQSLAMKAGSYYTLPPDLASDLSRAGYVRIMNDDTAEDAPDAIGEVDQPDITAREMAIDPKAPNRAKRTRPAKPK